MGGLTIESGLVDLSLLLLDTSYPLLLDPVASRLVRTVQPAFDLESGSGDAKADAIE
jgi:hypothetical protein